MFQSQVGIPHAYSTVLQCLYIHGGHTVHWSKHMNHFELLYTCTLCAFVMDFTWLIMMPPSLQAVKRLSLAFTSSVGYDLCKVLMKC